MYLAAILWMLQNAPPDLSVRQWLLVAMYGLLFVLVSNGILLWLAEALIWLAAANRRVSKGRERQADR